MTKKIWIASWATFILLSGIILISILISKENISAKIVALKYSGQVNIDWNRELQKELKKGNLLNYTNTNKMNWWYLLVLSDNSEERFYYFNTVEELLDYKRGKVVRTTPKLRKALHDNISIIEQKKPYGELIAWDEVSLLFARMARARIIDLETGLSLNVQRRAGSSHADVQPLTAQDTEILKKIYG